MARIWSPALVIAALSLVMVPLGGCKQEAKQGAAKKAAGASDAKPSPAPTKSSKPSTDDDDASDDDDDTSTDGTFFLKLSDVKAPSNLQALDEDEIAGEINSDSAYFFTDPNPTASSDDCIGKAMSKHKTKLTGSVLSLAFSEDIKTCVKQQLESGTASSKATITEATVRVGLSLNCPGVDLSKWKDKVFDETVDMCSAAKKEKRARMNVRYKLKGSLVVGGKTQKLNIDMKYVMSASDDGDCVTTVSGTTSTVNGCIRANVTADTSDDSLGSRFDRQETQKLTYRIKDKYYRSGKMNIELNGWKGNMTYTGASTAPKFSVTKSGDTATGTFTYVKPEAGINLTSDLHDVRPLAFKFFLRP